jgi:glycosyltransferase involved in cell wall biosynthesis
LTQKSYHFGFICNEYPVISSNGGIGSFTQTLGDKLVARGHRVTVFGVYKHLDKKIRRDINGVLVIAVPYIDIPRGDWEFNRWRLMRLIKAEHRRNNLSLLEVPDYQGWLRQSSIKVPKIVRIHSPQKVGLDPLVDVKNLPRSIRSEEESLKHADFICAVGTSVEKAARQTYLNSLSAETPITVIYNGIDTDNYQPKQGESKQDMNIVFAGRLTEKKGVIELVKAWPQIASKFPQAKLILAGRDSGYGDSGSMINELNKLLPEEIRDSLVHTGFLDSAEILSLFQNATLCIFPSHREAFSVVILEAMATGKPVIYSTIGPGYEIIEHGKTGLLCDPHSPDDIAKQVNHLLNDSSLMGEMGQKAREHVVANFSLDHIVKNNLEYFISCIDDYGRKG